MITTANSASLQMSLWALWISRVDVNVPSVFKSSISKAQLNHPNLQQFPNITKLLKLLKSFIFLLSKFDVCKIQKRKMSMYSSVSLGHVFIILFYKNIRSIQSEEKKKHEKGFSFVSIRSFYSLLLCKGITVKNVWHISSMISWRVCEGPRWSAIFLIRSKQDQLGL